MLRVVSLIFNSHCLNLGRGGGGGGLHLANRPQQKSVLPVSIQNRGDHAKIVFDVAMWLFVFSLSSSGTAAITFGARRILIYVDRSLYRYRRHRDCLRMCIGRLFELSSAEQEAVEIAELVETDYPGPDDGEPCSVVTLFKDLCVLTLVIR